MTDRLRETRRLGIHVPQLVGRVTMPKQGEDPKLALIRIVGEFDAFSQELQRFLRYLQSSNDLSVSSEAFFTGTPELVDGLPGDPGDPTTGWAPGDHKHQADIGSPVGLGNANALGAGPKLPYNDHVHRRDVRVQLEDVDVGTRNALNFEDSGDVDFALTDEAGPDKVTVKASLTAGSALIQPRRPTPHTHNFTDLVGNAPQDILEVQVFGF